MSALVIVETAEPVARITLNAPERLNAVDAEMLDALADAVARLDADPAVRVIVLTGSGRGFCAGANLAGDMVAAPGTAATDATLAAVSALIRGMLGSATPILALVNGIAAGVGVSIALAADYVLATESAAFTLAFANIALMPDGGATALVTANVGRARALRMALTAEKVSATTAAQWGLVSESCSDADFADRSAALIEQLAGLAPRAAALTKEAVTAAALDIDDALDREERGQSQLLAGNDFREGVAAFLAKRAPTFTGE